MGKRLEPRPQGPSGVVGHSDSSVGYGQDFQGYGTRGQQGSRPNTVSTTGVPGRGGRPSKPTHSSMEVNDGNSGDDLEVPLCSAHTRYVRPRAALNSNLEWRWIINLGSNSSFSEYEQVVKVEVCLSEGFSCDIVAEGHETVCRLLALNGS